MVACGVALGRKVLRVRGRALCVMVVVVIVDVFVAVFVVVVVVWIVTALVVDGIVVVIAMVITTLTVDVSLSFVLLRRVFFPDLSSNILITFSIQKSPLVLLLIGW